jgi:mxaJ protein
MRRANNAFRGRLRLVFAFSAALGLASLASSSAQADDPAPLRVCADPDNMPFSNAKREGFENKLSELMAGELGKPLACIWLTSQLDFVREALASGLCDVVTGMPSQLRWAETTRPYYWSSYVFISRADRKLDITSLKDHRLRPMKIGVASVRGDRLFTPPAHILAEAGVGANLIGYPIDGGGGAGQRARMINAVARGYIDIAAVWGPCGGYFAQRSPVPLSITFIGDTDEFSSRKSHFELLGLQYEIAMGVRRGNGTLHQALDQAIARNQSEIGALLKGFGVPLIEPAQFSVIAMPSSGVSN